MSGRHVVIICPMYSKDGNIGEVGRMEIIVIWSKRREQDTHQGRVSIAIGNAGSAKMVSFDHSI